jgi:phosphohistidine swiveling domain-containing protein
MRWFVYTRGTIPLHRVGIFFDSIKLSIKLNKSRFNSALYINEGPKLWWCWDKKEINDLGKKILNRCRTTDGAKIHFLKFSQFARQAITAAKKIQKTNLKNFSNEQLIELYDLMCKESAQAHGLMDIDIDAMDVVFEEFLQNKIKQEVGYNINQSEFWELYKNLSIPIYQSYTINEQKKIIKLAIKKTIKISQIKKIYDEFWWTRLGWENTVPHKQGDIKEIIRKYKKKKNLKEELQEINNQIRKTKKRRKILIKKYKLSPKITYWLKILDKYAYFHDLRKEMQAKTVHSFYLLLLETARRFKLNKNDLEWLWPKEIKAVLRGEKFNKKEVEKRKQAICVKVSKKGAWLWSGKAAFVQHKKELKEEKLKEREVAEIRGLSVFIGKIKAKVKVCNGIKEALQKIKKGEILVCGMTTPDYIPVIKAASAIITDEGGITCHAAIIARELKKPCIIGTKIATKVLKDGDLVEVDAKTGTVRILNKSK